MYKTRNRQAVVGQEAEAGKFLSSRVAWFIYRVNSMTVMDIQRNQKKKINISHRYGSWEVNDKGFSRLILYVPKGPLVCGFKWGLKCSALLRDAILCPVSEEGRRARGDKFLS